MVRRACPLSLAAFAAAAAAQVEAPAVEFGRIAWNRDFAAAATAARTGHRPLLALLQEVPG